jgi:hypothetical protein
MNKQITVEEAVDYLNDLCDCDVAAMHALVCNRVPCGEALADHESCQVLPQSDSFFVGMLGVINGMFGTDENGYGQIEIVFRDSPEKNWNDFIGFRVRPNETD